MWIWGDIEGENVDLGWCEGENVDLRLHSGKEHEFGMILRERTWI